MQFPSKSSKPHSRFQYKICYSKIKTFFIIYIKFINFNTKFVIAKLKTFVVNGKEIKVFQYKICYSKMPYFIEISPLNL